MTGSSTSTRRDLESAARFEQGICIALLFMVGLETNLDEMRQVGADSIRVAMIGVALPIGLGYAAIGRILGVIDGAIFSAIVLMIVVSTLLAPPWLKVTINQQTNREALV